jgi:hypothetical protein
MISHSLGIIGFGLIIFSERLFRKNYKYLFHKFFETKYVTISWARNENENQTVNQGQDNSLQQNV